MINHVDRFQAALTVLAGHGHIKQRLMNAYEENLGGIHEDELPIACKQSFADLRQQMQSVLPLNGEGPIRASVRKMSVVEASDCATSIVILYGDMVRMDDNTQRNLPLAETVEGRVPPFLVKSN